MLGLEFFVTDVEGIGGKLRTKVEDFYVEEIPEETDEDKDGEYIHFILEKRGWETLQAIRAISKTLDISYKRFGFAGTKDKRAITRQRVSVWGVTEEQLAAVNIRGLKLSDFKRSKERVTLGQMHGNMFRIIVRGIDLREEELRRRLSETYAQLREKGVPNYFGYQRFGVIRPNTHLVGREIVKGNLEAAVMAFLGAPFRAEKEDAYEARRFIEETRDFKAALEKFPKRLTYERAMLNVLSQSPRDYAGALRKLPKKLRWMLVHGYQSFLFNKILSEMIGRGMDIRGREIPLFGYSSSFSPGEQGEIEKRILEEEGIEPKDFEIKSMPELSSKGFMRRASLDVSLKFETEGDEVNNGKLKAVFHFILPPGSYATVVMREFMKSDPLMY
jgi:tRNA pseudouridine13 synthase